MQHSQMFKNRNGLEKENHFKLIYYRSFIDICNTKNIKSTTSNNTQRKIEKIDDCSRINYK